MINGGYNVYPKEVEWVIDELPGVKESAIIGLADPDPDPDPDPDLDPDPDPGEAVTAASLLSRGTTG